MMIASEAALAPPRLDRIDERGQCDGIAGRRQRRAGVRQHPNTLACGAAFGGTREGIGGNDETLEDGRGAPELTQLEPRLGLRYARRGNGAGEGAICSAESAVCHVERFVDAPLSTQTDAEEPESVGSAIGVAGLCERSQEAVCGREVSRTDLEYRVLHDVGLSARRIARSGIDGGAGIVVSAGRGQLMRESQPRGPRTRLLALQRLRSTQRRRDRI